MSTVQLLLEKPTPSLKWLKIGFHCINDCGTTTGECLPEAEELVSQHNLSRSPPRCDMPGGGESTHGAENGWSQLETRENVLRDVGLAGTHFTCVTHLCFVFC